MNFQSEEALYIGDSIYDYECAKGASVDFGVALWGAKSAEDFKEAAHLFEKPKNILKLIH